MKKLFFLALLLVSCGKNPISSNFLENTLVIDGDSADWQETPAQTIQEKNASMRVLNDSDNLYLLFQTTNSDLAQKAFRGGFKIWFDKKRKRGISYRGSFALADSMRSLMAQDRDGEQRPNRPGNRMPEFDGPQRALEIGRIIMQTNDYKKSFGENEQETLQASSTVQYGIYCYEFKIPLMDFDGLPFVPRIDDDTIADIGLEIGGIDENVRTEMGKQRSSMGGGRGGLGGRGGMGGRGGGSMSPMKRPNMDGEKIWLKIKLSKENE